ncbi:hypothetical protein F5Y14DRAFT_253135 [Nemania sp. NC0429]|nr:hypothetical protein F5Y14DRAFT_253135 [Nemania sp. NC0429]
MMFKQVIAAIAIAALGLVHAQDSSTTPSVCATGCVTGVFANAANIGCANGDILCVCGKTDSLQGGIRDCITGACPADGPDVQFPLAVAYGNDICAKAAAASAAPVTPASSTTAPAPSSQTTEATSSSAPPAAVSATTPVPSPESTSQSTTTSTTVTTSASSSASSSTSTTASVSSSATPASLSSTTSGPTSASSSSTSSSTSSPTAAPTAAATTNTEAATTGLSTAVKAGIGAGVGAAALAAIIIAVCVCLRRRQQTKSADRVRKYKISEPMSKSDLQFGNDIGRAEAGLPKPIITTHRAQVDATGLPNSPTSLYSNSSDLEAHARRYEDMPPRTQPRTMI